MGHRVIPHLPETMDEIHRQHPRIRLPPRVRVDRTSHDWVDASIAYTGDACRGGGWRGSETYFEGGSFSFAGAGGERQSEGSFWRGEEGPMMTRSLIT